jgi:tetratricopeptide (TPR) repeat protein
MQLDDKRKAALAQLERTESYLAGDPGNQHLLAAAVDQALAASLPERAAAHAQAAVERYPNDDVLAARLGNALLAKRRYAEAAALFDALSERHADAALAYGAAYARYCQGLHAEALARLQPHRDSDGLPAQGVILLVRLLHLNGEPEQALALALRQRARCGNDSALLAAASLAALDSNELEQAQTLADAALAGPARPAEALVTAGSLALARMDSAAADALLTEVVTARPEEGRAWSALGMASLLRRDLDTARKQLETALRFMPSHIGTWHSMGWCCLFAGDLAGARAAFEHALELDRNFGESHGGLAVVQAMAGERDEAQGSINRALRLDQQSLAARYAQMVLAGQTEDPERFRQLARRLMQSRQGAFGRSLSDLLDVYQGQ